MRGIEERVARLERSLRRSRAMTGLLVTVIVAAFALGAAGDREIVAERITVSGEGGAAVTLDASGVRCRKLTVVSRTDKPVVMLDDCGRGRGRVEVSNRNGKVVARLWANGFDNGKCLVAAKTGKAEATMGADENSAGVAVSHAKTGKLGAQLLTNGGRSRMSLASPRGKKRVYYGPK